MEKGLESRRKFPSLTLRPTSFMNQSEVFKSVVAFTKHPMAFLTRLKFDVRVVETVTTRFIIGDNAARMIKQIKYIYSRNACLPSLPSHYLQQATAQFQVNFTKRANHSSSKTAQPTPHTSINNVVKHNLGVPRLHQDHPSISVSRNRPEESSQLRSR